MNDIFQKIPQWPSEKIWYVMKKGNINNIPCLPLYWVQTYPKNLKGNNWIFFFLNSGSTVLKYKRNGKGCTIQWDQYLNIKQVPTSCIEISNPKYRVKNTSQNRNTNGNNI